MLNKPHIHYFRANTSEVMAGETVEIEWEVENARKVKFDGHEAEVAGKSAFIINGLRTFELTAKNIYGTSDEFVTVGLLKPKILLFEPDATVIREGEPVHFSFKYQNTLQWRVEAHYSEPKGKASDIVAEGKTGEEPLAGEQTISFVPKAPCTVTLFAVNGSEVSASNKVPLHARRVSLEIFTDKTVVVEGSTVHLKWAAQNATKILLLPGKKDVTSLSFFDFVVDSDKHTEIEIEAQGDFGQVVRETKSLFLASISSFTTSNNEDPANPVFYLNWTATGMHTLKLLPDNVFVEESRSRYVIEGGHKGETKILEGETRNGEKTCRELEIPFCSIVYFKLEKARVIAGTMASLSWEVNGCNEIYLLFSDSGIPVKLAGSAREYHFQATKEKEKVTLIAWGGINVAQAEIPIQVFQSPELKYLSIPALDFHLGVTWLHSPPVNALQHSYRNLSQQVTGKKRRNTFFLLLARCLMAPSAKLLEISLLSLAPKKRMTVNALQKIPVSSRIFSILQKLKIQLLKNFIKEHTNEQQA